MTEPQFLPTTEGADQVVRRGNRRRLRSAVTTGTGLLAVAGVVVAAPWQGTAARDSLVPARDPLPSPVVTTATPAGTTPPLTASQSPGAAPVGAAAAPTAAPSEVPRARPTAAAPARRTAVQAAGSPITRGTSTIAAGDLCPDEGSQAAQGWCLRYTGPATARRGRPVTLSGELCRLASFPAATVTFSSSREVLLDVQGTGWEAGRGQGTAGTGRTVTVGGGSCLTWASTWDTRDAEGFLVLPGTYGVDLGVEAASPSVSTTGSLQVTD